jgi:hypothetical protein
MLLVSGIHEGDIFTNNDKRGENKKKKPNHFQYAAQFKGHS